MGSFFIDLLSFDHEVAVFERDPKRMRFTYNCQRFTAYEEIEAFKPELLINAVTLKYTIPVFQEVIPHLPKECIISDIASVKTDLREFYEQAGMRYVSTHPMFGPTFANLQQLSEENAIIISEGDYMGRIFFKDLYQRLGLNINVGHVKSYVQSGLIPRHDPVAAMLRRVGGLTWDGRDRIEALARQVPTDLEEWPRWFHVWFCALVHQWSGGDGLHGNACAPLLVGEQAAGKSRFCRALLPPELRWGWIEKVDFTNEVKVMRAMSQFLLMNIDEFNQTSDNVQRGTLKNLMQLPDIRVPKPYVGVFETLPRRASFIGTCNPTEVLADETGNRRFICVQVTPGARIELPVNLNYDQLYAQAVQELRQRREHPGAFAADDPRGRTFFTRDEEKAIMLHNRRFEQSSLAKELFDSLFEPIATPKPKRVEDGTLELTRAEILARLEKVSRQHFSEEERRRLYNHLKQLTEEGRLHSHDISRGKGFHVREVRA